MYGTSIRKFLLTHLSSSVESSNRPMSFFRRVVNKLGIEVASTPHTPVRVFLLDDDTRRHQWFAKRFANDHLDVASNVAEAMELLASSSYDHIFLDHDLLPEHYNSPVPDDEQTGYAIATWLAERPEQQPTASIVIHTRNADGALRMAERLRSAGRQAEYIPFPLLTQKIDIYRRS